MFKFTNWIHQFFQNRLVSGSSRRQGRGDARSTSPKTRFRKLQLEQLEDRTSPAVASLSAGVLTVDYAATGIVQEQVTINDDGTSITLTGDVSGATSNLVGNVNRIVATDNGASTSQFLTFSGTAGFSLSGGLSSTGVESIRVNDSINATGTSNIVLNAPGLGAGFSLANGIDIAANLTTTNGDLNLTGTGSADNGSGVVISSVVSAGGVGNLTVTGMGGGNGGTAGDNYGVYVTVSGHVSSGGAGTVSVTGIGGGGSGSANNNYGVLSTGQITAAGSGAVTVQGIGGASAGSDNLGIFVETVLGEISSSGGDVSVIGNGGGTGTSADNYGVKVYLGAIWAGSPGTVTVKGIGGASAGNGNYGVYVTGPGTIDSSGGNGSVIPPGTISTSGGNVFVIGQGGGAGTSSNNYGVAVDTGGQITAQASGTVTVQGSGGASDGVNNYGVYVSGTGSTITSSGGNVKIAGQGGGTGTSLNNFGVFVDAGGQITDQASGAVTVQGTGGASDGVNNVGVNVWGTGSTITSSGGNVKITGQGGGAGTSLNNFGVLVYTGGQITARGSGAVTVLGTGGFSDGDNNHGVYVSGTGSTITSSGGNVSIVGQGGGAGTSNFNYGVAVDSGGEVLAGASGTVTVDGTGGTTNGHNNNGVDVVGSGSSATITSGGGNVSITGQGGGTGTSISDFGVLVNGQITAGGLGAVSVSGTGGATAGSGDVGVSISAGTITSSGGNVSITGQGGGTGTSGLNNGVEIDTRGQISAGASGTVTVKGTGGSTLGNFNNGVAVIGMNGTITSSGGNVSVTGQGGGTGTSSADYGIDVEPNTLITAGSMGAVTVNGSGAASAGGSNYGVYVLGASAMITSAGAAVSVTGVSGNSISEDVRLEQGGAISSGGTANLTITANSLNVADANSTIQAGTAGAATATIQTRTAGTLINLGGTDVLNGSPRTLGLTNTELKQVSAATLIVGAANSGAVIVSASITRPSRANMQVVTGGDVNVSGGQIYTGSGTLLFTPGPGGSVKPNRSGVDATAGTTSFSSGSNLTINIAGPAADAQTVQLNVNGAANITGANLSLTGAYVPKTGDIFTIVAATSVVGTFNGLPQGTQITFNGATLSIDYTNTDVILVGLSSRLATPEPISVGPNPISVAVRDLNGDGLPDVAVLNSGDGSVSVLVNQTTTGSRAAAFSTQPAIPVGARGSSSGAIALADINGDGRPDIVVTNSAAGTISVLLNQTPANATTLQSGPQMTFLVGATPISLAIADLNGDGRPDVATVDSKNNSVEILLNTTTAGSSTPSFAAIQAFAAGTAPIGIALADLNGDGRPDIIVVNAGGISVLRNATAPGAASAVFAAPQSFASGGNGAFSVAVADFNGDGRTDLAVGNSNSSTIGVLLNTTGDQSPSFSFAAASTFAIGVQATNRKLVIGDLNGDGRPDVIAASDVSNAVSVLLNTTPDLASGPTFAAQELYPFSTGKQPWGAAVGDFNFDGLTDMVVTNQGSASVTVLLNATASALVTLPVEVADFPHNGLQQFNRITGRWLPISGPDPVIFDDAPNGTVVAAFAGYGVGLYKPTVGWTWITPAVPTMLVMDLNGDVFGEFPGYGIQEWKFSTSWRPLSTFDASLLAIDGYGDVAGVFANGVNLYRSSTSQWSLISPVVPNQITMNINGALVANFPNYGVMEYQLATGQWHTLTTANPDGIGVDSNGDVIMDLPGYGIDQFVPWLQYKGVNPWVQVYSINPWLAALDQSGRLYVYSPSLGFQVVSLGKVLATNPIDAKAQMLGIGDWQSSLEAPF